MRRPLSRKRSSIPREDITFEASDEVTLGAKSEVNYSRTRLFSSLLALHGASLVPASVKFSVNLSIRCIAFVRSADCHQAIKFPSVSTANIIDGGYNF